MAQFQNLKLLNNSLSGNIFDNMLAFYNFDGNILDSIGTISQLITGGSCSFNYTTGINGASAIQFNNFGTCASGAGLFCPNDIWNLYEGNTKASFAFWFKYNQNIPTTNPVNSNCGMSFFGSSFSRFGFAVNPNFTGGVNRVNCSIANNVSSPVNTTIYDSEGNVLETVNGNVPNSWKVDEGIVGYVVIGSSATRINFHAFAWNELTFVTIVNSVTSIDSGAFMWNPTLTAVHCYTTRTAFVGNDAFQGCGSPLTIHARITDDTWTEGTGLSFQGNSNVTVIKDLINYTPRYFDPLPITVGEWNHIAGTYDNTTRNFKVYRNGNLVHNYTYPSAIVEPPQDPEFYKGFGINGSAYINELFIGEYGIPITFESAGLWTRVLTEQEVSFLYNSRFSYSSNFLKPTFKTQSTLQNFSPINFGNLRLWVDANEGVIGTLGNYFTDENASVQAVGFNRSYTATKSILPRNGRPEYRETDVEIYWNSSISKWTVYINECCDEEGNSYFEGTFTGIGDVPYPWLADWTGSGGSVTRTPTTQDTLAINDQGVEKWINKVLNSDYLRRQEGQSIAPTFKTNVFGLSALLFNTKTLYADNISDTNFDREFSFYIVSTPLTDVSNELFGAAISIGDNLRFGVGDNPNNPTLLVQNIIDPYNSNLLTNTIDNKFGVFSARGNLNEENPIIKISKNLETEEIIPNFAYSINSKSVTIGSSSKFGYNNAINSNIAEILVYQDYHDDVKAQIVINYLTQKHNINTNPPTFAPDSLPELQLWADAGQGVLNLAGNNFTDETANMVTAGFPLFGDGVDPNNTFYVYDKLNNKNRYLASFNGGDYGGQGSIYWDGSRWVFMQVDLAEEGSDEYYLYATGDTQYPWNANWGGGRSITRTPTTTDIVASNGMTVERWLNKVGNRSINSASNSNNRPTYNVDGNGRPALYFDGNDFMSGNLQTLLSRQFSYYFVSSNLSSNSGNLAAAVATGSNRGIFGVNDTNIGASNGTSRYSSFSAGIPAITDRKVYSARFNINNAGQPIIGLNKTYETLSDSIGAAIFPAGAVRIGASSEGSDGINCYFSEILVYRAFHSERIANKIVDYLNAKWGITPTL